MACDLCRNLVFPLLDKNISKSPLAWELATFAEVMYLVFRGYCCVPKAFQCVLVLRVWGDLERHMQIICFRYHRIDRRNE